VAAGAQAAGSGVNVSAQSTPGHWRPVLRLPAIRDRNRRKGILLVPAVILLGVGLAYMEREVRQARLDRQLIGAVTRKDRAAVTALLRQGANPSARDLPPPGSWLDQLKRLFLRSPGARRQDWPTALLIALRNDDPAIARTLVDAHADPNAMDREHVAPLALTLSPPDAGSTGETEEQEDVQLAERLLDMGANPNVRDAEGTPALVTAVRQTDFSDSSDRPAQELVRHLLRKGADVNAPEADGKTALLWSAWDGLKPEKPVSFPEGMRLLLQSGADPRPSGNAGWSLLNWAANFGDTGLARTVLAKRLTVNTPDGIGRTALQVAVSQRQYRFLRFLLERGADVNAADHFGMTPLLFAVQNDDAETARLLLQQGASWKAKERAHGRTVAQFARSLHAERCLTLLQTGNIVPPVRSHAATADRVPLDAGRWLVIRRVPGTTHDYLVILAYRRSREQRIDSIHSYRPLKVDVFRDGDGSPLAFVRWEDQGGGAYLYRFVGGRAVRVWEEGTRYGSDWRPLQEGGCVVWTWRPAFQEIGSQDPRRDDMLCLPYCYRNGRSIEMEGLYFPGCLNQQ
jgi:ankyrin repeat protein